MLPRCTKRVNHHEEHGEARRKAETRASSTSVLLLPARSTASLQTVQTSAIPAYDRNCTSEPSQRQGSRDSGATTLRTSRHCARAATTTVVPPQASCNTLPLLVRRGKLWPAPLPGSVRGTTTRPCSRDSQFRLPIPLGLAVGDRALPLATNCLAAERECLNLP